MGALSKEEVKLREQAIEQTRDDIIVLLTKEPFFAYLAVKMKKVVDERVPVAGISVIDGEIILYINPTGYLSYTKPERLFILKHEVLHVIYIHYLRKGHRDHSLWNVATDVSINQLIESAHCQMPVDCLKIDSWQKEKGFTLPEKENAEKYYQILWERKEDLNIPEDMLKGALGQHLKDQQGQSSCPQCNGSGKINQNKGDGEGDEESEDSQGQGQGENQSDNQDGNGSGGQQGDAEGNGEGEGQGEGQGDESLDKGLNPNGKPCPTCKGSGQNPSQGGQNGNNSRAPGFEGLHPTWGDSTEVSEQLAEDIVRSMVSEAVDKSRGNVPGSIKQLVDEIMKSKVNWRAVLRNFVAKRRSLNKKATWKKRNRRLGTRVMGYKKSKKLKLVIAVDTSGSVSDKELAMFNGEMQKIYQSGAEIDVIECDAQIHNVYKYTKKIERNGATFKGRGGTDFRPVFEMVNRGKMDNVDGRINEKPDAVIFLTDGYGPAPDKFKIPTLWCLTPGGRKPYASTMNGEVSWGSVVKLED